MQSPASKARPTVGDLRMGSLFLLLLSLHVRESAAREVAKENVLPRMLCKVFIDIEVEGLLLANKLGDCDLSQFKHISLQLLRNFNMLMCLVTLQKENRDAIFLKFN